MTMPVLGFARKSTFKMSYGHDTQLSFYMIALTTSLHCPAGSHTNVGSK